MFVFSAQRLDRLFVHRAYCLVGNGGSFTPEGDTELKIHLRLVTFLRMPGVMPYFTICLRGVFKHISFIC
jgi:hypothetical protein